MRMLFEVRREEMPIGKARKGRKKIEIVRVDRSLISEMTSLMSR